jgi:hypothetical protein
VVSRLLDNCSVLVQFSVRVFGGIDLPARTRSEYSLSSKGSEALPCFSCVRSSTPKTSASSAGTASRPIHLMALVSYQILIKRMNLQELVDTIVQQVEAIWDDSCTRQVHRRRHRDLTCGRFWHASIIRHILHVLTFISYLTI